MQGRFRISSGDIHGWVFDPANGGDPMQVRVTFGEKVLEGVADQPRPDVARLFGTSGNHGFRFSDITVDPTRASQVAVEARANPDKPWQSIQSGQGRQAPRRRGQYQTFPDAKGGSKSSEKLAALKLDRLPNAHGEDTPLKGLSVLDIGCNEGFFCGEALRQGAARVVGIDQSKGFLSRAQVRFPQAQFIEASWWNLPNEKFDVIFFLSAIHYEPEQRALLDKLAQHLTPTGVLVLECGVAHGHTKSWQAVQRHDGIRRYPTLPMLQQVLLKGYASRWMGPSVLQGGDPVPRFVFHCPLRHPTALIVTSRSGIGKSTLAATLEDCSIPQMKTDQILNSLRVDKRYIWSRAAQLVTKLPKSQRLTEIGNSIAQKCPQDFADVLLREAPTEADIFCIEGEILRHDSIRRELVRGLRERGIRVWTIRPED